PGVNDDQGAVYQIRGQYALGDGGNNVQGRFPRVWNLATGELTRYPNGAIAAVADNGTGAGDKDSGDGAGGADTVGLIGHDGALQRLPNDVNGNYQIHVYDISADGHTVYAARHVAPGAVGTAPVSTVAVLWHC